MKPSMNVLKMCLLTNEVENLGHGRYLIRWGNNRATIIKVEVASVQQKGTLKRETTTVKKAGSLSRRDAPR